MSLACHTAGVADPEELVALAEQIARRAHTGQRDQAGEPYIEHPRRVAGRVAGDPEAEAVAWLHDVVEDCPVSLQDLLDAGFPPRIVAAVDAITKRDGEHDRYYARLAADPLARRVKLADIADNCDPQRLAALDTWTRERLVVKYARSRRLLGVQP